MASHIARRKFLATLGDAAAAPTAKALGLAVPAAFLAGVDEGIE
jgi:hypothetical protein